MKRLLFFLLFLAPLSAQTYQPTGTPSTAAPRLPGSATPSSASSFTGVCTPSAYAPVIPGKLAYAEWYWHQISEGRDNPKANPIETGTWAYHQKMYGADYAYKNFAPQFRAQLFDPDQWASTFADSGAKYVVLTSKHHEGFALWPSKEASATWGRPWNSIEIGPKRDLLGDLSDAVRSKGLKMGSTTRFTSGKPALAHRQTKVRQRPHDSAIQRCRHALQAIHHIYRRRMGDALRRLAQPRDPCMALQRFSRQG